MESPRIATLGNSDQSTVENLIENVNKALAPVEISDEEEEDHCEIFNTNVIIYFSPEASSLR